LDSPEDIRILGVSNAAAGPARGGVAPGEIISLFGKNIGAQKPAVFTLDKNGRLPAELGGVRVFIAGTAVPLLFAQEEQINAVTPFSLANDGPVPLVVEVAGRRSSELLLHITKAVPEIFRQENGISAVVNQDGTINSDENPALEGSFVSFYCTGMGKFNMAVEDGTVAGEALGQVLEPVTVLIGGVQAETLYAGAAPGFVNGLVQVNVRLPAGFRFSGRQSVEVRSGIAASAVGALRVRVP